MRSRSPFPALAVPRAWTGRFRFSRVRIASKRSQWGVAHLPFTITPSFLLVVNGSLREVLNVVRQSHPIVSMLCPHGAYRRWQVRIIERAGSHAEHVREGFELPIYGRAARGAEAEVQVSTRIRGSPEH